VTSEAPEGPSSDVETEEGPAKKQKGRDPKDMQRYHADWKTRLAQTDAKLAADWDWLSGETASVVDRLKSLSEKLTAGSDQGPSHTSDIAQEVDDICAKVEGMGARQRRYRVVKSNRAGGEPRVDIASDHPDWRKCAMEGCGRNARDNVGNANLCDPCQKKKEDEKKGDKKEKEKQRARGKRAVAKAERALRDEEKKSNAGTSSL
jgi:hypothetical protein